MGIKWSKPAEDSFSKVINNLPQFHRTIAERLVKEKSEELAKARGSDTVEARDLIAAFFKEVPPAFKEMMKKLFGKLNIDYRQYCDEENTSAGS